MSDDITHDLDLLDDWLAGKGYGEEAGLVLRALSLIHKQAREIEKLRAENETHKEIAVRETMNVATLRAALKRLYDATIEEVDVSEMSYSIRDWWSSELRAAAAALKETGDE